MQPGDPVAGPLPGLGLLEGQPLPLEVPVAIRQVSRVPQHEAAQAGVAGELVDLERAEAGGYR